MCVVYVLDDDEHVPKPVFPWEPLSCPSVGLRYIPSTKFLQCLPASTSPGGRSDDFDQSCGPSKRVPCSQFGRLLTDRFCQTASHRENSGENEFSKILRLGAGSPDPHSGGICIMIQCTITGMAYCKLTTAPVLAFPQRDHEYLVYSGASDNDVGAILSQKGEDKVETVVA